jgi:hypothetical protein
MYTFNLSLEEKKLAQEDEQKGEKQNLKRKKKTFTESKFSET